MALRVAVGGRESNSFCTVEEADAAITLLQSSEGADAPADWIALSQGQKEFRLQLATAALSYFLWRGKRVYCGQALPFPRDCQEDVTVIPDEVKTAQAQIAYTVIHQALKSEPVMTGTENPLEGSNLRVTQVSLGGLLSVTFSGDPAKAGTILTRLVQSLEFPIYLALAKFTTQVRGGIVGDAPNKRKDPGLRSNAGFYDYYGYSSQGVYRGEPFGDRPCLTTTTTESTTSTSSSTEQPTTTTTIEGG